MKVVGPNGLTVDVPVAIATGLVGNGNRGFRLVTDEEVTQAAPKPKRKPGRPRKQETADHDTDSHH